MTRLRSLRPPVAFAHRGASAHARENTLDAFVLARRLGATGLESDVWLTADGQPVLDHDGTVGSLLRRRPIARVDRSALPGHIPTLEQLYTTCGTDFELSLDVKDPAAVEELIAVADSFGTTDRLWLCHPDWELVATWRSRWTDVKLVDSTRLARMDGGPERRAAELARSGVDCINLHHSDWSAGLVTLFHRFGLFCFGWDAQLPRILTGLLDIGIDGVYSDHVDRMTDAFADAGL